MRSKGRPPRPAHAIDLGHGEPQCSWARCTARGPGVRRDPPGPPSAGALRSRLPAARRVRHSDGVAAGLPSRTVLLGVRSSRQPLFQGCFGHGSDLPSETHSHPANRASQTCVLSSSSRGGRSSILRGVGASSAARDQLAPTDSNIIANVGQSVTTMKMAGTEVANALSPPGLKVLVPPMHEVADADSADLVPLEQGLQRPVRLQGLVERRGQRPVHDQQVDQSDPSRVAGCPASGVARESSSRWWATGTSGCPDLPALPPSLGPRRCRWSRPREAPHDVWVGVLGSSNPVSSASRLRSLSWKVVSWAAGAVRAGR